MQGTTTCDGKSGSWGYYAQDAAYYASLGAAYVKVDSCGNPSDPSLSGQDHDVAMGMYTDFQQALQQAYGAAGLPVPFYSMCGWYKWYPARAFPAGVGNSWRVGPDALSWANVLINWDTLADSWMFTGPGQYLDPDEIGPTQSPAQQASQMNVIAITGAPLLLSFDLRNLTADDVAWAANPEVIAVHQDDGAPNFRRLGGGPVSGSLLSPSTRQTCDQANPTLQWRRVPSSGVPGAFYLYPAGTSAYSLHAHHAWSGQSCGHNEQAWFVADGNNTCCDEDCTNALWVFNETDSTVASVFATTAAGLKQRLPGSYLTVDPVPNALFLNERYNETDPRWLAQRFAFDDASGLFTSMADGTCIGAPSAWPDVTNVWVRLLADGSVAAVFLNTDPSAEHTVTCDASCFAAAGFAASNVLRSRDIRSRIDNGTLTAGDGFSVVVPANGASAMFRFTPTTGTSSVAPDFVSALPAHPRLVLTEARKAEIRGYVESHPDAASFWNTTQAQADFWMGQRVPGRAGPSGSPNARMVLQQVYSLGMAWAITGQEAYALRAIEWVGNATASPQWDINNTAQLNTGEMMHVAGFALDWFYELLSPQQRADMVTAIVNTGLARVWAALDSSPPSANAQQFVSSFSNWNTVILGGTIMGCLAVAGEPGTPDWVTSKLLPAALANLKKWSASAWDPEGAWPEGPNYSGYAARYLAPTVAAMKTATGSDGGLLTPGALKAQRYHLHELSPALQYYYYYDARPDPETVGSYLAYAGWASDAAGAYGVRESVKALAPFNPLNTTGNPSMNAPVALLYFTPLGNASDYVALPTIQQFPGVTLVTARSSWVDPNATFISFKGRIEGWDWAHSHLDGLSWIYQSEGTWFSQDLGADSYALPQYFSKSRYSLYRTSTAGHNTLSFAGANQYCVPEETYTSDCSNVTMPLYVGPSSAYGNGGRGLRGAANAPTVDAYAIVDATQAYSRLKDFTLERAQRGFIVAGGVRTLVTVDEVDISSGSPPPLWWSMHTIANISLAADGTTATLTTYNTSIPIEVAVVTGATTCPGVAFVVTPIDLQPPYVPTPGVSRLTLIADALTCTRLVVAVGPAASQLQLQVNPLAAWEASGPIASAAAAAATASR